MIIKQAKYEDFIAESISCEDGMLSVDWGRVDPAWKFLAVSLESGKAYFSKIMPTIDNDGKLWILESDENAMFSGVYLTDLPKPEDVPDGVILSRYADVATEGYIKPPEEKNDKLNTKYQVEIKNVTMDVYDVLMAFNVTNPAIQHAVKKLLKGGQRGHKDLETDYQEAIVSIERAIELENERRT